MLGNKSTIEQIFDSSEYNTLLGKYNKVVRLLEDLTPGGSEFVNDPEYCAKFIREQRDSIPSQILPFKKQNDKLKEQNKELLEIVKGLSVIFYKELQSKFMPDEKTPIYPIIKAAIQKAILTLKN